MLADCIVLQSKKRQYDQEIENLEKQQKQTIERLEQEHTNRLRDEAKRIKGEQEKELSKFQNMLRNRKKEVRVAIVVNYHSRFLKCKSQTKELGIIVGDWIVLIYLFLCSVFQTVIGWQLIKSDIILILLARNRE